MVRPAQKPLSAYSIDKALSELFPAEFVQENVLVPLEADNQKILIGAAQKPAPNVLEDLRLLSGRDVEIALYSEEEILDQIGIHHPINV